MAIIAVCPKCKARLKAPEELIGKTVKCPGCTAPVTVRAAAATPPPATVPSAPVASAQRKMAPAASAQRKSIVPAASALARSTPPVPAKPSKPLDELPEVDDEEDVADVLEAEDDEEIEEVDEVEEEDRRISTSRSARRRSDEEDEDDDDEDTPRRKKKSSRERDRDRRDNEKTLAMLLHLSSFLVGFLGPLIIWLVKKQDSRFVDHHGRTHLNFVVNLFVWSMGIAVVGGSAGCLLGLAVPILAFICFVVTWLAMAGMGIYSMIMVIIAAVNAKNGVWYELPASFAPFGRVRDEKLSY